MNIFVLFIHLFTQTISYGWEALEKWNDHLEQELIINCHEGETLCHEVCGSHDQCRRPSNSCHNCVGTGVLLSHFYQNVGSWYMNSGHEISENNLVNFLKEKQLIVLTSSSPFHIFGPIGDRQTEFNFNKLCPNLIDPFPIVLAELTERGLLHKPSLVICHADEGTKAFEITNIPHAEIHHPMLRGLSY
jgi:hypothetical protein